MYLSGRTWWWKKQDSPNTDLIFCSCSLGGNEELIIFPCEVLVFISLKWEYCSSSIPFLLLYLHIVSTLWVFSRWSWCSKRRCCCWLISSTLSVRFRENSSKACRRAVDIVPLKSSRQFQSEHMRDVAEQLKICFNWTLKSQLWDFRVQLKQILYYPTVTLDEYTCMTSSRI